MQLISRSSGGDIAIQKAAGAQSIAGTFQVRASDTLMEAKTLVVMRRAKVSQVTNPKIYCRWAPSDPTKATADYDAGLNLALESILVELGAR